MEDVPETWGKSKYPRYLQEGPKGGSRKLQTDQLHLSLREGDWEQIIQDTISRYFEEKVTGNSQHVFMKGKSCVINLITFYNEMTGLVDEWEVVVVYRHFSKGFDTVICKILRQPDEARTSKWRLIDNCLNCQAQRVVITGRHKVQLV